VKQICVWLAHTQEENCSAQDPRAMSAAEEQEMEFQVRTGRTCSAPPCALAQ
jgi:hypothetical protein